MEKKRSSTQDFTNLKRPKGGPVYSLTDWEWRTFLKVRDKYNEKMAGMDPSSLEAIMLMADAARDYATFIEEKQIKHFNQRTDNGADHEKVVESAKEEIDGYLVVELRTIVNRREKPAEYAAKWRIQILQELNEVIDMHLKALGDDEENKKRITDYIPTAFNNAFPVLDYQIANHRAATLKRYSMPMDNVTRSIFDPNYKSFDPDYTGKGFPVGKWETIPIRYETKKDPGKFVFVYDYGGRSPVSMGPFHELICNVCGSILLENEQRPIVVSVDMLGRKCMGKKDGANAHPIPQALADDITRAVDDLTRFLEISDFMPGTPEYDIAKGKRLLLPGEILPDNQPVMINGTLVSRKTFLLHDYPLTWKRVCEGSDRDRLALSTRDLTFLDVPGLNKTKEGLIICQILLKRIVKICHDYEAAAKNGKNLGLNLRCITLEWFLGALEYVPKENPEAEKKQKKDLIRKIKKVLDFWVSKGLIGGYNFRRDTTAPGNPYHSIEITFPKRGIQTQRKRAQKA